LIGEQPRVLYMHIATWLFRWKVPEPALIAVAAAVGLVLHRT
jgi:chromate transport protein ChrA